MIKKYCQNGCGKLLHPKSKYSHPKYCPECSKEIHKENVKKAVEKHRENKKKMRICEDCGIREVEKKCKFCSECAITRRQHKQELYRYNWIQKRKKLGLRYC